MSEILKGQPGVELQIKVDRIGVAEPFVVNVLREEIKIPNIPYYGMVEGGIGYIKLTNFTQNAGGEVKKAFNELKANNELKGIILDLRGNGGGLLNEAVNICNVFVDEKQLIVSTKAKVASKSQDHLTRSVAVDKDIPLAILIDKGSASASEIVAGAIQDLDRGVIIGQRSYGKGLVQNVIPLSYNSQVKITVAKYYIPSGRCIQSIDYFHKDENGNSDKIPDSLISEFKTKNGRLVYDGGGIAPDISVDPMKLSKIAQALITKYLLFDYASLYASTHSSLPPADEFEISDETYNDLIAYLKDKNYDYQTASEDALDKLKASAKKDNTFDIIEDDYNELKTKILHNKSEDLITYKDQIKLVLKDEIVGRYYYQKGRIVAALQDDPEIDKAVEVLLGNATYLAILDGTVKPPKAAESGDDEE